MCEVYQIFSDPSYDFSADAKYEMWLYESKGIGNLKQGLFQDSGRKLNGFILGKKWMQVTLNMWLEDIKNEILFESEIFNDPKFKDVKWWLNKVLLPKANK